MKLYYGIGSQNTDSAYTGYLRINNCGCFEGITKNEISRKEGRLDYQLIYVKSGKLTVKEPKTTVSLSAGDCYLFRPHEPQNYAVKDTKATYFWIHFTGSAVEEMLAFLDRHHFHLGDFPEIESFCFSFYRSFQITKTFISLTYEGRLITLFGKIAERLQNEKERKNTERLAAVLTHIDAVFPRKPSNEELAGVFRMSKYHFIKVFKATMGETPQSYLNRLLVEKARLLLRDTSLSVSEIAQKLGIDDPLYFSRLFKKHSGISPLRYRNAPEN